MEWKELEWAEKTWAESIQTWEDARELFGTLPCSPFPPQPSSTAALN